MVGGTADDRLTAKREFANQDDIGSRKRFEVLNAVYRSQSEFSSAFSHRVWSSSFGLSDRGIGPSPEDDDPLAVKRELENQDGPGAQEMFEVLNAVNRGQSWSPPSHFRPTLPVSHVSSCRHAWRRAQQR